MSSPLTRCAPIDRGSVEELLDALLEEEGFAVADPSPIPPRGGREGAPLSFGQRRLWFLDRLTPGTSLHSLATALRLEGRLDPVALDRSLHELARRHEALRSRFPERRGEPVLEHGAPPRAFGVVDLEGLPGHRSDRALREALALERRRPFDLARGPLCRFLLLRLAADHHVLLTLAHHMIVDGSSIGVLTRELTALYAAYFDGSDPSLQPPALQYSDFAAWQRERIERGELEDRIDWWRGRLEAPLPILELPTDRPRPAVQSHRGASRTRRLSADLADRIEAFGRRHDATLFMVLLAGFDALLARWTGQQDLLVGTPVAGRSRPELEDVVGFFVNTVVLRVALDDDPAFGALVDRVRETALESFQRQEVPFDRLVEEVEPERSLGRQPVFQVMLSVQNAPADLPRLGDLRIERMELPTETSAYDLSLDVEQTADGVLVLRMDYAPDLWNERTIERTLERLEGLLRAALDDPGRRISELPLLTPGESDLLRACDGVSRPVPDRCVHELVEERADRQPDLAVLTCGPRTVTLGRLEHDANRLANHLLALGAGPGVGVGICLDRTEGMVTALLAVLKTGGWYLPLDPALPSHRLRLVLEDARVPLIVTCDGLRDALPPTAASLVLLDADARAIAERPSLRPRARRTPDLPAYTLYTSGSTGRPKGVQVADRALLSFLESMRREPGLGEADVLVAVTTLSFDIAGLELYLPLIAGAGAIIASREEASDGRRLAGLIAERRATVLQATPATWQMLRESDWPGASDLEVLCGGEALPRDLADWLLERCASVWNLYGPTETTIWSAVRRVEPGPCPVTLGHPIDNTTLHVLDPGARLVPLGTPGELWIGGAGLALGYLGRPSRTAERFVPDPFGDSPGARLYRTGDLVRRLDDGDLEFLGRLDHQVKIRGFRIELGEVEAVLGRHPGVREVVVVSRRAPGPGRFQLVAYWVAGSEPAASPTELRRWTASRLPDYMVPAGFVQLGALPQTPNGKIDRKALPDPTPDSTDGPSGPRSLVDQLLAEIWCDVLQVEHVRPDDSFFELGGHSLLVTRLVSRVRDSLGVDLPVARVFEAPTFRDLVEAFQRAEQTDGDSERPLVPVPRDGDLPLSFAQQRLWFHEQLFPGTDAYLLADGLRIEGIPNLAALRGALEGIVARHEVLRTRFVARDGVPAQEIDPPGPIALPLADLHRLPPAHRGDEARRLASAIASRPFDLAQGPLLRAALLHLEDDDWVLLLVIHHIVSDGWSSTVLYRELEALYSARSDGRAAELPELAIQHADFAAWQRTQLEDGLLARQLDYWTERLAGAPRSIDLAIARTKTPFSREGRLLEIALGAEIRDQLHRFARQADTTLFTVLLAAWCTLLSRLSGQTDIALGSPVANRGRRELEELIGFLVNTVVLRIDLAGDPSFDELLGRVRSTVVGAAGHPDLPFEKIVEELRPERGTGWGNPLYASAFGVQETAGRSTVPELAGLRTRPFPLDENVFVDLLNLFVTVSARDLSATVAYNVELFDEGSIRRLMGHFARLLEESTRDPRRRLSQLPLLSAAERHQLLVEWNSTGDPARPACLHELFADRVAAMPDSTALVWRGEAWSYRELARRADRLTHYLLARGAAPEVAVAIYLERTPRMAWTLLAVLGAGAAYVPLDPAYPADRLSFILADSRAPLVVTSEALLGSLPDTAATVICLERDAEAIERCATTHPRRRSVPGSLAYLIYTSGSTGQPKGVAIEHRSASALVEWARKVYPREALQGVLAATSICFDLSIYELFVTLAAGGTVILADNALALPDLPAPERVLLVNTVPSAATELVESGALSPPPLTVNLAGEPLRPELVDRLYGCGVGAVYDLYGPSEDTTYSTFTRRLPGGPETIGRPVGGTRAFVLDGAGWPVPIGLHGELYLGGAGLARGYLGRPSQTAARFVPNPFAERPGARLYRTGDLVRHRPDGNLEFLGRLDHQVKIRGFRIELGEIEAALRSHPGVADTVVTAFGGRGSLRLAAYVVGTGETGPDAASLREHLESKLPGYMVPALFVPLPELPLTPNGKIDRRALPEPDARRTELVHTTFARPSTPEEERLVRATADILGLDQVGVEDDFFALGGDSILGAQLVSRAAREGLALTLQDVFAAPTVAGLAARAVPTAPADQDTPESEPQAPLGDDRLEDRYPLTPLQQGMLFHSLQDPDTGSYLVHARFELHGEIDPDLFERAWRVLIGRHAVLRTGFAWSGLDEPLQEVHRQADATVELHDWRQVPAPERDERLRDWRDRQGFELHRPPLLRCLLVALGDHHHHLELSYHHLILDGWSILVLLSELRTVYEALRNDDEPELLPARPFRDLVHWLRRRDLGAAEAYWRELLAGFRLPTPLPMGRETDAGSPGVDRWGVCRDRIPEETLESLRALGRTDGLTVGSVLLGAWALLLGRYSGRSDVVFGNTLAGRPAEISGAESMVGLFINTVPVRASLPEGAEVVSWLTGLQDRIIEARRFEHSPLARVQRWSDLPPGTALFESLVVIQSHPVGADLDSGTGLRIRELRSEDHTNYPLLVTLDPQRGQTAEATYDARRFEPTTIRRLLGHFGRLLEGIAQHPRRSLDELPMLTGAEEHQLRVEWNDHRRRSAILDRRGRPLPIGLPGELYLDGPEPAASDASIHRSLHGTGEAARYRRTGTVERLGSLDLLEPRDAAPAPQDTLPAWQPPRSPAAVRLAEIWCELLGLERVGTGDRFLLLGGDSILAVQAATRAIRAGYCLAPQDFLGRETLGELAARARTTTPEPPAASQPSTLASDAQRARLARSVGGEVEDAYPLTPLQEGMLFYCLREPEGGLYVSQLVIEATGPFDEAAFARAWEIAFERHPMLRTAFVWEGLDEPLQVVRRSVTPIVETLDWRGLTADEVERRLDRRLADNSLEGFEPSRPPLMRLTVAWIGRSECIWVLSYHHLLLDGWSLSVLLPEVLALYESCLRGDELELPEPLPYRSYIDWLRTRDLAADERFWRQALASYSGPSIPAVDRAPGGSREPWRPYEQRERRLDREITDALRRLARTESLTLNTIVEGAWSLLIGRYCGRDDAIFGIAVAGRPASLPGIESVVGLMINALPMSVELPSHAVLVDWLRDLQDRRLEIQRHEHTPLVLIRRWCDLPAGTKLFELFLSFQSFPLHRLVADHRGSLALRLLSAAGDSGQPLTLLAEPGDELALTLTYDPRRYEADTVERLLRHLANLLRGMAETPHRTLADLPMLDPGDDRPAAAPEAASAPPAVDVESLSDQEVDALLEQLMTGGTD